MAIIFTMDDILLKNVQATMDIVGNMGWPQILESVGIVGGDDMRKFGVIGLGSVGYSIIHGLSQFYSYAGYDVLCNYKWKPVLETDIVFVSVGTPMDDNERLDCSNVEKVLKRLHTDQYSGVVVVKSTVSIGFTDDMAVKYPGLRLVYMPEFLREKNSYSWFMNPDRIVAAGSQSDVDDALSYFTWVTEAEIIRTDFKSAEEGKLAHNSYIATKVSFTNEIENISKKVGANPYDVMRIVWTDRRVLCSEHLTPGLGPYGGKCVVKDTNELMNSQKSEFLAAVRKVNDNCGKKETVIRYNPVVVIIPTKNRPDKLPRALNSVANQTYRPELVIVVNDPGKEATEQTDKAVSQYADKLPICHIVNSHTENISGAINSGLELIGKSRLDLDNVYIALLDDDDWWERKYLENCVKFAREYDSDWVVSGLIRHDNKNTEGAFQDIPVRMDVSQFLVTNPNVQNSNLFVRANKMMAIGGYDEKLVSTTDRDVCIRLLQSNNIRYSILRNHLVHHDASDDPGRLSYPGSTFKKQGLSTFYKKYSTLMSPIQKTMFKKRAKTLFKVEIEEAA
jgi:UDPglucose 6-dehydrogenase